MYHYTYLIQHKTENKRYIGVRTSKVPPLEDTSYWGSSKYLPYDVAITHKKFIFKIHPTRKEAVAHEVYLHQLNDVAANPTFYNKARQTSTGFDTSGIPLSDEMKHKLSISLKGRIFTNEHRERISKSTLGKPKSKEHAYNCSIAQKKLAQQPGYRNPRQGCIVTAETRKKLSDSIKARGSNKSIRNNRFTPWFITDLVLNVTYLFYAETKEEFAVRNNYSNKALQTMVSRSKGYLPIKSGQFKDKIIGNIKDAQANINKVQKPLQKRAWYITYPTFSIPFYYETRKEYAQRHNVKVQTVLDALHISKGTIPLKRGPFKGLILGTIT